MASDHLCLWYLGWGRGRGQGRGQGEGRNMETNHQLYISDSGSYNIQLILNTYLNRLGCVCLDSCVWPGFMLYGCICIFCMGMDASVSSVWAWMPLYPLYGRGCICILCMGMDASVSSVWAWMHLYFLEGCGCICIFCMGMDAFVSASVFNVPNIYSYNVLKTFPLY